MSAALQSYREGTAITQLLRPLKAEVRCETAGVEGLSSVLFKFFGFDSISSFLNASILWF